MNFLAHAYLSFNNPELLTGNMIADATKGKKPEEYPDNIKKGILLHRAIDSYTDQHPLVKETRQYFSPVIRHYALVISDVIYDHFLGTNWKKFHPDSLLEFSQVTYGQLQNFEAHFPDRFSRIFPYMKENDWFGQYATRKGIHKTIQRLSYRSKAFVWADQTIEIFENQYEHIQQDFMEFFPQLEKHSKEFIESYQGG